MNDAVLRAIRTRRVSRSFTTEPVAEHDLRTVLDAGRWALSAGNRRLNKFLVVQDPRRIALVRALSPGMLAHPTALIIIVTDLAKAAELQVQIERDQTIDVDVGTAAMNMSLAASAIGLGSCPATSFSHSGLSVALDLPSTITPKFILQLGHSATESPGVRSASPPKSPRESLVYWEHIAAPSPRAAT